jgi:DNA-binding NarL/FixJ family response regulator
MTLRSAADWRAVAELATDLLAVRAYAQVPALLLPRVATVVGGDAVTLTHLDLRTRHEVVLMWPPTRANPQSLAGYPAVAHTHPLRAPLHEALLRGTPVRTALRISDVLSAREWRNTAIRRTLPDVADQLCLPLRSRGPIVAALSLGRASGSFSERQRDLLDSGAAHLRAALARAHAAGADITALQLAPSPGWVPMSAAPGLAPVPRRRSTGVRLSRREEQVLELVARGLTDAQIAHRLGLRPATVSKHLHRTYRRLDVANRAQAALLWREQYADALGRPHPGADPGVRHNGRCG